MTAAKLLLELVSREACLWVEGDRLRYRAPVGALDDALRHAAAGLRTPLRALVKAGAVLPADRSAWDDVAVADFEERAGMLAFEGRLDTAAAEREAERQVRLWHTQDFLSRMALVSGAPSTPASSSASEAVATLTSRRGARTG